jgi:Arc/MetJ family transcription regulator
MATNLAIDDGLLSEAQKVGKFKTKRETVDAALREFVQRRRKQEEILGLFGKIEYDAGCDYKKLRRRP